MKKAIKSAEDYADIIIKDLQEEIISETPVAHGEDKIERIYEFRDGAVVKYEWQSFEASGGKAAETFNHRFTLIALPEPNTNDFKKGIIKSINYPS
jgi:hypothetical protein